MGTSPVTVEVCVEDLAGVRAARAAGAQGVELCAGLAEGGLTPSHGAISAAVAAAIAEGGIEVVVLVRPRGGDFLYSADELDVMERDVASARVLGAHGVALGCLDVEGAIDERALARLVRGAGPLQVTFHRAFDHAREPLRALETLVALGVRRVLSSGGEATALEGRARLAELSGTARGRLTVVAAGGVRPENVAEIVRSSGVRVVHLSGAMRVESAMRFRNARPRLGSTTAAGEEYAHRATDPLRVRAVVERLRTLEA